MSIDEFFEKQEQKVKEQSITKQNITNCYEVFSEVVLSGKDHLLTNDKNVFQCIIKIIKPDWNGKVWGGKTSKGNPYLKLNCPLHPPDNDPSVTVIRSGRNYIVYERHASKYNINEKYELRDWLRELGPTPRIVENVLEVYYRNSQTDEEDTDEEWAVLELLKELKNVFVRVDIIDDPTYNEYYVFAVTKDDYKFVTNKSVMQKVHAKLNNILPKPLSAHQSNKIAKTALMLLFKEQQWKKFDTIGDLQKFYDDPRKRAIAQGGWGVSIPFTDIEIIIYHDNDGNFVKMEEVPRSPEFPYRFTVPHSLNELRKNAMTKEETVKFLDNLTGGFGDWLFDEIAIWLSPVALKPIYNNFGVPNAGKTTLSKYAEIIIGEDRVTTLSANQNFPFQGLEEKKLIVIDELHGLKYKADLLKMLSGAHKLPAEEKGIPKVDVLNVFNIIINSNTPPLYLLDDDEGMKARYRGVPFMRAYQHFKNINIQDVVRMIPALVERTIELLNGEEAQGLRGEEMLKLFDQEGENGRIRFKPRKAPINEIDALLERDNEPHDAYDLFKQIARHCITKVNMFPPSYVEFLSYLKNNYETLWTVNTGYDFFKLKVRD